MPDAAVIALAALGAGLTACIGTRLLIPLLILDQPNERSSHRRPTPRGGGIAPVGAIFLAWLALAAIGLGLPGTGVVITAAGLLAAVSWLDDLRDLSPLPRVAAQALAVLGGMLVTIRIGPVFQGWLPPALDAVAAGLAWLWFLNVFNFMDGIDGLAGSEAATIGLGLLLCPTVGIDLDPGVGMLAAPVAAAAIGFLVWNWAPAQIFLGDVGSVPFGYLLGFLLLAAAARGHWRLALILPLYFLADATITLVRRLARGERVWKAHREHFYQRAVQRGVSHAAVAVRVVVANLLLIGCGWWAENGGGHWPLGLAIAIVAVLLASLNRGSARP